MIVAFESYIDKVLNYKAKLASFFHGDYFFDTNMYTYLYAESPTFL